MRYMEDFYQVHCFAQWPRTHSQCMRERAHRQFPLIHVVLSKGFGGRGGSERSGGCGEGRGGL